MKGRGRSVTPLSSKRHSEPDESEPQEADETWALWLAPPWKRARFPVGGDMVEVVFRGSDWWSNGHGSSRTNVGAAAKVDHGLGYGEDLIRTADFVDFLHIQEVTEGSWIGRPVLQAQVVVRHEDAFRSSRSVHGLVLGDADRVDLAVDVERGVILRAEAWFEGSLYRILEMSEVRFDVPFSADTFELQPLPGQEWQPVEVRRPTL